MTSRGALALLSASLLLLGDASILAQSPAPSPAPAPAQPKKLPPDQLDSLVSPIALYPDPLLAQVLAASTYPLEIVQLQQWMAKNKSLKDKALVDAVAKQPWDPSIQALAAFPDAVKRLADDVAWTADLGNAFLAQESDVMDSVQRMRKKAVDAGKLKSSKEQKVDTQTVPPDNEKVIVIQPASTEVIYVPSYDPVVVWGPPIYPYPPIYYPYYPYYPAGMFISFGIGIAWGAMWGGWWGGCHWGGGSNVNININNNFNRVDHRGGAGNRGNVGGGNRVNAGPAGGGNKWSHNPQHRGGTPYGDRATANKFGGNARGDSLANRQAGARQQIGRSGAPSGSNRGGAGTGAGSRPGGGAGDSPRPSNPGSFNRSGSADRVGSRDIGSSSRASSSRGSSGFGGGYSGGYSGSRSRASSSRGASSFGGGGFRGGGGGGRRR